MGVWRGRKGKRKNLGGNAGEKGPVGQSKTVL